jgi:hypothetical protein
MRISYLFLSLINLLFGVLLIVLGIFIFMIPRAPNFQGNAVAFLTEQSFLLSLFGIGIGIVGIFLLIGIYPMNRRNSYYLTMGSNLLTINESIIKKYLSAYWKALFPNNDPHYEVAIRDNQIYLTAVLPYVSFEEQKKLLERIESDLQKLLARMFDYRGEFYLTVSFQDKKISEVH